MIVTELIDVSKGRSKVYIDNEFAFVLYKGELRQYGLKLNGEIKEDDYREIMEQVLTKRGKLRCMNLLKSKEYTERQLRDKMKQGFYPESIINEAIDYVKSYHYVDDERYARQFLEYNLDSKSRKRIELDLLKKGIDKQTIQEAFEKLGEEGIHGDELGMMQRLLEKKHYDSNTATNQEKSKMYAFLYRKGFSMENIRKIIQNAEIDD